jgi:hypothetical protein
VPRITMNALAQARIVKVIAARTAGDRRVVGTA